MIVEDWGFWQLFHILGVWLWASASTCPGLLFKKKTKTKKNNAVTPNIFHGTHAFEASTSIIHLLLYKWQGAIMVF